MARKSQKGPPTVEPNQFGCVWNFSGMFDHHHDRHHRKLLSDESHGRRSLPGTGHARSQVRMLTFDEQLRCLNIESKKKNTKVNHSLEGDACSSDHTGKYDEIQKNSMHKTFWKKIKSRYESSNKKKESPNVDTIVVLKPSRRLIDCPVDVGCNCSYLHPHMSSTTKQQIIKPTHVSFNHVRKKLKIAKKLKNDQKMKSIDASEGSDSIKITSDMEKLSIVPFSKKQEPEVFIEARKHLVERLRQVAISAVEPSGSSTKRVSRTLERVLLSSPIHESMASFDRALERVDRNHILDMRSNPNSMDLMVVDGCFRGSQPEFSLDVSSPKAGCKLTDLDNDQFRENPSPVSVLDSYFTENICSPTSTIESVELQTQPHRLYFEENLSQTSSPPHEKTSLSSFMNDRGFISSYVNDIYESSQSNWEDFVNADYPLDSSCDHKLLHDCVKEVLVSLHSRITFVSSKIRPFSLEKDVFDEVLDQVDWHNGQPMITRTLDILVRRDIAKCGDWVDVVSDRNDIVFELVDDALQGLIIEAISDILV